ncbi:MAG: hypothetical protein WBC09_00520 [Thermoanaerobaculia bacterium]
MRSERQWGYAPSSLRRFGLVGVAAVYLAACGGDSPEVHDSSIDVASLSSVSADTVEGLLVVGTDGLTLQPCGSAELVWVAEARDADLRKAADGLSVGSGTPVLARVLGKAFKPRQGGPGAAYESGIYVLQWVFLAEDTSGCPVPVPVPEESTEPAAEGEGMPVLPAGVTLRALGNEPFWHVDVAAASVRVGRLGFEDLEFAVTGPAAAGGIRTWAGEGGGHRFELVVEQAECPDTMADRTYSFTARLTLDGQELSGCALEASGGN